MKTLQAIRGMHDVLPAQALTWQYLEDVIKAVVNSYGYQQLRLPIVEYTELFKRSIGECTDIVEKEMYSFLERNEVSVTLRPEGTAGCVRAGIEHGLLYNQVQRFWYRGPMFRYEKPQKGRYRQFHQVGVETFGFAGPDIDAELLLMTARLWHKLGLQDTVRLQLNSLGDNTSRQRYREVLIQYLNRYKDELDADSQRRLTTNPLRILDSKDARTREILKQAPILSDFIDQASKEHFTQLIQLLDQAQINYEINPYLVRGLDYYGKTVFEWVTDHLGAQGTVCAGGRYDALVEQLGGQSTPAIGFALGLERLVLLLENLDLVPAVARSASDIYIMALGNASAQALLLAERLRQNLPWLKILSHCGGGGLKNQLKKADKSGARMGLILGEDEIKQNVVAVKFLREDKPQEMVAIEQLEKYLTG